MRRITLACALTVAFAFGGIARPSAFEDGVTAYDHGQFQTALELWLPLAEHGDVAAQYNVAVMYEKGTGVAVDEAAAARWYLAAANQGEADSQYRIAQRYESGTGVTKDAGEAEKWYAALAANPRAAPATKLQAREHLVSLSGAGQEVIPYQYGRFVIVSSHDGTCVIALQGAITADARWKFADVIARSDKLGCNKPWLMLESSGGGVLDGLSLGEEVRAHEFRTITRYECASACAFIFLGGTERVLAGSRARIGLHQPATMRAGGKDPSCVTRKDVSEVRDIGRYMRAAIPATSEEVMHVMMDTSCKSISWVNGPRALELGIATSLEAEDADVFGPKWRKRDSVQ